MVSRDLVPIARGCAGARSTGKPLQIAVDDVAGTIQATQTRAAISQEFRPIACGVAGLPWFSSTYDRTTASAPTWSRNRIVVA